MDAHVNTNKSDQTTSLHDTITDTTISHSNSARQSLAGEAGELMSSCKAMMPKPPEGATLVSSGTVNINDSDLNGAKCKGGVIEITPLWVNNNDSKKPGFNPGDGNKVPGFDPGEGSNKKPGFVPGQGYEGNGKPIENPGTFPPEGFGNAKPMPLPYFDGDTTKPKPAGTEGSNDGSSHRHPDRPIDPGFDHRPHRPGIFGGYGGYDPRPLPKPIEGNSNRK